MNEWLAVMALYPMTVVIELFLFAVFGMSVHEVIRRDGSSNHRRLAAVGMAVAALVLAIAIGKFLVALMASNALGGR